MEQHEKNEDIPKRFKTKNRFLKLILSMALLVGTLAGCSVLAYSENDGIDINYGEIVVSSVSNNQIQTNEIKTIEPPEDGWTLEQLNEVMYLNGKPFKLPCNVNDISDDFEVQNNYPNSSDKNVILDILYNGKYAFTAEGIRKENETIINGILIPSLGYEANIEKKNLFRINGFKLSDTPNELLNSLGEPFSKNETRIAYLLDNENIELGFIISNDNTINSMYIKKLEEQ